MAVSRFASRLLDQEARALLTRLARVKPFVLLETMVPAAALLPAAQSGIERFLDGGRRRLRQSVNEFIDWLHGPAAAPASDEDAQRRFTFLRLRFNAVLTQFDLFSQVVTQRSEHEIGVWLSGLDVVSADALRLPGDFYKTPPIICYLDRGIGAAIRRARTRLPGGGSSPVGIIRVPRERMVGSGIASSLIHEVGHQASALLDLVESLRPVLQGMQRGDPKGEVWRFWERWISEILSDFWSVARVGITSTMGLIGVVSLPRVFVFRLNLDDPHPVPWLRVKLSCAMGEALYPHPQWRRLASQWESFYPLRDLDPYRVRLFGQLQASMPAFVALLINHRPKSLRGRSLGEVLGVAERQPVRLQALYSEWGRSPADMYRAAPSLAFAVIGQARADGAISPEQESELFARLLTYWAKRSTLDTSFACALAAAPQPRARLSMRHQQTLTLH